MFELFLEHPRSVGETYVEHFQVALGFGTRMLVGGLACIIHAFVPALFERTASKTIAGLYGRMVTNRRVAKGGFELDYAI